MSVGCTAVVVAAAAATEGESLIRKGKSRYWHIGSLPPMLSEHTSEPVNPPQHACGNLVDKEI